MNLSRQLARRRLAEQAPALAGHVVAHVDRFLDVAAGLGLDLPHLAGHQVGQLVLVLARGAREAEEDVRRARRRDEPPALEGLLRGRDGAVDVLRPRARELAEHLARRGDDVSNVSPPAASTHSPPMEFLKRSAPATAMRDPSAGSGAGGSMSANVPGSAAATAVAHLALLRTLWPALRWRRSGPSRRSTMTVTFGLSS